MTWKTHVAIGTNAVWLTVLAGRLDSSVAVLLPAAMFASLLPDIDAVGGGAKVHYIAGGIFGIFRGRFYGKYFHHRGIMHSLFMAGLFFVLLSAVAALFLGSNYALLPFVFSLSYFSHSLIDSFNDSVGYFYPFKRKQINIIPRRFHTRVGGPVDTLFLFIGAFGILLFFTIFTHTIPLFNSSTF